MLVQKIEAAERSALWFGNSEVTILVSSFEGVDGLCVIEHRMHFGEAPPLHVHEREDEVFYCMEGEMLFEVDGSPVTIKAGQSILAPKGVPHRFRVVSPAGAHCLTVTRGRDFETMVKTVSRQPSHAGLPTQVAPTPEMIDQLTAVCAANSIVILGPPLM